MAISQVAISVCNDGNVSQLDCADTINGGVYYRIEVYRSSQPSGGYGVTSSGSRAEDICGIDHLEPHSNRTFRYIFSITDWEDRSGGGTVPIVLEGWEQFNPDEAPDGSWEIRLRDLDSSSEAYGSIFRVAAQPEEAGKYRIHYELRLADREDRVAIHSPLEASITELSPSLVDLGSPLEKLGSPMNAGEGELSEPLLLDVSMERAEIDERLRAITHLISDSRFVRFRENLDKYEAFGDFGPKAVHPGTNLAGPNKQLASESIFARQYRAALVFVGRVVSPEMARGAADPLSLAETTTNTRPGVYEKFVTATVSNIAIYKLGLDKVHSDYGGVPMKLAPGSRMEDRAEPVEDAWRCNQTLGEIAKLLYLTN
ncbi:MAG TPA: hypothetical protein DEV93_14510 [Chloroflexi bacterium]|jgi:hypothetical protein|nr:hypothetical protein [Chloroflexota bacterium]